MKSSKCSIWVLLILVTMLFGCGGESEVSVPESTSNASDNSWSPPTIEIFKEESYQKPVSISEGGPNITPNLLNIILQRNSPDGYINNLISSYDGVVTEKTGNTYVVSFDVPNTDVLLEIRNSINLDENVINANFEFVSIPYYVGHVNLPDDPWEVGENIPLTYTSTWDEDNPGGNNWGPEASYYPSVWRYREYFAPVVYAVIDTSFIDHDDYLIYKHFKGTMSNGYWETPYYGNIYPDDFTVRQHGTNVAGIIGSLWNNSSMSGAINSGKLIASELLGNSFLEALNFALKEDPVVINISMGHSKQKDDLDDHEKSMAVVGWDYNLTYNLIDHLGFYLSEEADLYNKKVVLVTSAGNYGIDAKFDGYMCSLNDDVISNLLIQKNEIDILTSETLKNLVDVGLCVGAVENLGGAVYGQVYNFGNVIDVYAPGHDVLSLGQTATFLAKSDEIQSYGNIIQDKQITKLISGTSYAAPHVSGLVAMINAANTSLTAKKTKQIVLKGAELGGKEIVNGKYLINAKKSVELALYNTGVNSDLLYKVTNPDLNYTYYVNGDQISIDIDPIEMTFINGKLKYEGEQHTFTGAFDLLDKEECSTWFTPYGLIVNDDSYESCLHRKEDSFIFNNISTNFNIIKTAYIDLDETGSVLIRGNGIINSNLEIDSFPAKVEMPSIPALSKVKTGDEKVTFLWSAVNASNFEYNIFQKKDGDDNFTNIGVSIDPSDSEYVLDNLENKTLYSFFMVAKLTDNGIEYNGKGTEIFEVTPDKFPAPDITSLSDNSVIQVNTATNFTAEHSNDDYEIKKYTWSFGDGSSATGSNVSHTYSSLGDNNGEFTVTLIATDIDNNESSPKEITIKVNDKPTASFTISDPSNGIKYRTIDTIEFDGSESNDTDGEIKTYSWNFGDGQTGSSPTYTHNYSTGGVYTASLIVTDNDNATSDSITRSITVNKTPTAKITVQNSTGQFYFKPEELITFASNLSFDQDGSIESYIWDFGDGSNGNGSTVSHTYTNESQYEITLTVTDDSGETDTDSFIINIQENIPPTASISSPQDGSKDFIDNTINFVGSGTDEDGIIEFYSWDFGDGSTSSNQNQSHSYSSEGTYTVSLTVTDNDGISGSSSISVTIEEEPSIDISGTWYIATLKRNLIFVSNNNVEISSAWSSDFSNSILGGTASGTISYSPESNKLTPRFDGGSKIITYTESGNSNISGTYDSSVLGKGNVYGTADYELTFTGTVSEESNNRANKVEGTYELVFTRVTENWSSISMPKITDSLILVRQNDWSIIKTS